MGQAHAADDCSAACAPPLRGGVRIEPVGGNSWCSSGFIVRGLQTGNRYVLTAGHCSKGNEGEVWRARAYHFSPGYTMETIGAVKKNKLNSGIDAMIVQRENDFWTTEGSVFMREGKGHDVNDSSRDPHWSIDGYSSNSNLEGQRVCLAGARTGSSCGAIKYVNGSATIGDDDGHSWTVNGLVRTGLCAGKGDSGGAIVRGNYTHHALGIYTGFLAGEGEGCHDGHIYTGITSIMNAFESTGNSFELVTW